MDTRPFDHSLNSIPPAALVKTLYKKEMISLIQLYAVFVCVVGVRMFSKFDLKPGHYG